RSHDGSGSCHGGGVEPPEDESVGGNVVDVVAPFMRGCRDCPVEPEDPTGAILRVAQQPECGDRDSEPQKQYGTHRCIPFGDWTKSSSSPGCRSVLTRSGFVGFFVES